jgi:hypothetical protein
MKVCFLSLIPMNVDSAATESKVYIITETLQLCMIHILNFGGSIYSWVSRLLLCISLYSLLTSYLCLLQISLVKLGSLLFPQEGYASIAGRSC